MAICSPAKAGAQSKKTEGPGEIRGLFFATDFKHARAIMIEPPETPHVHHAKHETHDRQRWFDIAIALAVVLVSVGSLYVSLHTGKTMEKLVEQNSRLVRANSVPLLQFDSGNIGDDNRSREVYMAVRNAGTGPARIVWFELMLEGKPVGDFGDLLPAEAKPRLRQAQVVTSSIAPSMMPAGERRKLLSWPLPPEGDAYARSMWKHVDTVRQQIRVEACYCSLFDECWRTNAQADVPKPVASCAVGNRISYEG
jgi:hypothetical protein